MSGNKAVPRYGQQMVSDILQPEGGTWGQSLRRTDTDERALLEGKPAIDRRGTYDSQHLPALCRAGVLLASASACCDCAHPAA